MTPSPLPRTPEDVEELARDILAHLRSLGSAANVEGQRRFGITPLVEQLGVPSEPLRALARLHRRDQALAEALWRLPVHETRLLAPLVADPLRLTREVMESWALDFDAWNTCDNACIHCFRKTPHAFDCARAWVRHQETFVKRAGFALVATLAVHAKKDPDARLLSFLPEIEQAADDERNFVKKAVNWALRQIGKRNAACRVEALACARRILARGTPSARWIARDALRELEKPGRDRSA